MEQTERDTKMVDAGWLTTALGAVWEKVVIGDTKLNPEKSCYQLAAEYRQSGMTPEECARNFIRWQTGKAGAVGFALGLPGVALMPLAIPADLASVAYLQLRMIVVIGILFGWEPTSDKLRTVAYSCLLGTAANEAVWGVGVKAGNRFGRRLVGKLPGKSLKRVNDFLGVHNLFIKGVGIKAGGKPAAAAGAKAGAKGIINLAKVVPLLGGIVGGGLNVVFTRQMGHVAVRLLKDGPPDGGKSATNGATAAAGHDGEGGLTIDGSGDIVENFVSILPEEYTIQEAKPHHPDTSIENATE